MLVYVTSSVSRKGEAVYQLASILIVAFAFLLPGMLAVAALFIGVTGGK